MKEWAHTFGAAVHQRTVQQETTTGRAGTLPNFLYEKDIVPGQSIVLTADVSPPDNEDEYDTGSSAEEEEIEDINKIMLAFLEPFLLLSGKKFTVSKNFSLLVVNA